MPKPSTTTSITPSNPSSPRHAEAIDYYFRHTIQSLITTPPRIANQMTKAVAIGPFNTPAAYQALILFSPPEDIAVHPSGHTPVVTGFAWDVGTKSTAAIGDSGLAHVTARSARCVPKVANLEPLLVASSL
jgi:hypothetical protein